MTKPTMTSQWDPRKFKPLDMSKIPGYPRKIPPKYENWLPIFTGSDRERNDYHLHEFWDLFQFYPISYDDEYLEMKLFSTTLHGNARRWYDNIPDAIITTIGRNFFQNMGHSVRIHPGTTKNTRAYKTN